ncbi:MAG TPA: nuclear transport factor 2 family protein [Gammaproteobacteria bacterium]|nr:nuclear transport factor 2 family protein [Gammaproteobacteria bacterium]
MNETTADKLAIYEILNNWVIWSDSGDWERFATVWHEGAWMTATWFQGPASEFVKARRAGFERGVNIIHFLGALGCDVAGARAIAQSKMTIGQRATVDGLLVDVLCTGRFYDFLEKRDGRWGIVRRQPIYEKDRLDPVDPAARLELDRELLDGFPEGYRHLAYLQTKAGFKVRLGLPGLHGPEVQKLYAEGRAWLEGAATPGEPL